MPQMNEYVAYMDQLAEQACNAGRDLADAWIKGMKVAYQIAKTYCDAIEQDDAALRAVIGMRAKYKKSADPVREYVDDIFKPVYGYAGPRFHHHRLVQAVAQYGMTEKAWLSYRGDAMAYMRDCKAESASQERAERGKKNGGGERKTGRDARNSGRGERKQPPSRGNQADAFARMTIASKPDEVLGLLAATVIGMTDADWERLDELRHEAIHGRERDVDQVFEDMIKLLSGVAIDDPAAAA